MNKWYPEALNEFKIVSVFDLLMEYIEEGRIELDSSRHQLRATYHDPCNIARRGGVIEAPRGAHFTECPPDYERDESFQAEYAATAKDAEAWAAFRGAYLDAPSHQAYLDAIDERGSA